MLKHNLRDGRSVRDPRTTPTIQDYAKAIYKLQAGDARVAPTVLAEYVGTSPAAVTRMMQALSDRGLVDYEPYAGVTLNRAGEAMALETIRHHRLIECYLHDVLGYAWDEVDAEAERLEHHISEELEARMAVALQHPEIDPHGDPIPRADLTMPARPCVPLADVDAGAEVDIQRVSDSDPDALRYLASIGMTLGAHLDVLEKQPFNGPLRLSVGGNELSVGRDLAARVFVLPRRRGAERAS